MKREWILIILLTISVIAAGQKKWKGGDAGNWDEDINWEPYGVPEESDNIILDNSFRGSTYVVKLPLRPVTVASLTIRPSKGNVISVILPKENLSSPALKLTGSSDALLIDSGGVFLNSSGLTTGSSINCAGSIRINNGGRYIHNSRSVHANDIVAKLSSAPGTEEGIFEFDVPAASTTVSLSNRVFGKLRLSSTANSGNVSYSGSGVNPLLIRSDLEIGPGVNFSVSFSNTVTIRRNLEQRGGTFNIANAAANTVLSIHGDVIQETGTITKTGTAIPRLEINGSATQNLDFRGNFTGDIIFRINNPDLVNLLSPLSLAYRFELVRGKLRTSASNLLTLLPSCKIAVDSTGQAFIDGPLKKEGLAGTDHFLFPVGKHASQRWAALKNATGSYVVEYETDDPGQLSKTLSDGLHHISSVERWRIQADAGPAATAKVELSFDHVNSGGVTELATLRVAQLRSGYWTNDGNTAATGSPGAAGSVISDQLNGFNAEDRYFTLASSVSGQNTLPLQDIFLAVKRRGEDLIFNFRLSDDMKPDHFILEGSQHGVVFTQLASFIATPFEDYYMYLYHPKLTDRFFRLKAVEQSGTAVTSKVISNAVEEAVIFTIYPSVVRSSAKLMLEAQTGKSVEIQIVNMSGQLISTTYWTLHKGKNELNMDLHLLRSGLYILRILSIAGIESVRFIKL